MSNPASPASSRNPWDSLLHRIADKLVPVFQDGNDDRSFARQAAIAAIAAYHPESRADFVNIARIIAFSMAALTALGIAAEDNLPPAQKMRYFGRANTLNRSADQNERVMMQRRRDQRANPPAEVPPYHGPHDAAAKTPSDPDFTAALPGIDAAVEEAVAAYRAAKASPEKSTPAREATPARGSTPAMEAAALATIPAAPATPSQAAAPPSQAAARMPASALPLPQQVRHSAVHQAAPNQGQHPRAPYKTDLLQRSALQRVVDASFPVASNKGRQPSLPG